MITLSLTEAVRLAFLNGGEFTRGASGIVDIPRPGAISVFGITLVPAFAVADSLSFYYLGAALLILGLLVVWRIHTSRLGWVFRSLRQNEDLAESIGIDVASYRILAYAFCCALRRHRRCLLRRLPAEHLPERATASPTRSTSCSTASSAGSTSSSAPIVGAFLLVIAFELLHDLQQYQALIYGLLMIAVMLLLPNGILSLSSGAPRRTRRSRCRDGSGAEKEAAE